MKRAQRTAEFYNRQSHKYDKIYSSYLRHTHHKLLSRLTIEPGESVLDCSAGTGILATEIFERFDVGRLHLNDPAADMLNVAKQKLTGISQGITYSNFYAEELHQMLPDQFDHLICLNSFHYYVDQARMISNAYKLLSPGGTLWLLDWNRKGFFIINSRLIDWFSSMNIQTRTLEETECMLKEHGFTTSGQEEWRFRLWNFFSLRATKRS